MLRASGGCRLQLASEFRSYLAVGLPEMDTSTKTSRPTNAILAIAVALLPAPALMLLDRTNQGCGDGSCGLISGLLILAALAAATLVFVIRSARRNETPAALRFIPLAAWALALVPLTL
jgi:hypothetical protein